MPLKSWVRVDQFLRDAWKGKRYLRWILIAIPLILILAILGSVMAIVEPFVRIVGAVLNLLVESREGRFIFLNLVILVLLFFLYKKGKKIVSSLFGYQALGRFLEGLNLLALEEPGGALKKFRKVYRTGKVFDLEKWVPAYPEITSHAILKIAFSCQKLGMYNEGMKWLEILSSRPLSSFLRKNAAEVKAVIYALNSELLPETVEKEIEKVLKDYPKNIRVLYAQRDRFERAGDLPAALAVQEKICRAALGKEKKREMRNLCTFYLRLAKEHLSHGNSGKAREAFLKAAGADRRNPLPSLFLGDLENQNGNPKEALEFWSRVPSYPAFQRILQALRAGSLSTKQHLPLLLKKFNNVGILSVLSDHFMESGETDKAHRLVEKLYQIGFPQPSLHRRLGDHFFQRGMERAATEQYRKALYLFLLGMAESKYAQA